jgi:hypothetical protein
MPTKSLGCCALALRTRQHTLASCPKPASEHGTVSFFSGVPRSTQQLPTRPHNAEDRFQSRHTLRLATGTV